MSSTFINLVSPVGTGPAVDVSGLSAQKNLSVSGLIDGLLIVEGSIDGAKYQPILQVNPPPDGVPQNVSFKATVNWVRTNRIKALTLTNPTVAVGGEDVTDYTASALSVPAIGGMGVALDVSAYGRNKSLVVGGRFDGALALLGSQDGTSFDSITKFIQAGQEVAYFEGVYKYVKLSRVPGPVSGGEVPSVSIAGVSDPGGSSPGGAGFTTLQIAADDMRVPTIGGWYTMGIASLDNDYGDRESALPLRSFPYSSTGYSESADPPTMVGAGTQQFEVPAGAVNLELVMWHKNFGTLSGSAQNVACRIAFIEDASNVAHTTWQVYNLGNIVVPNNARAQRISYTIPLATIGMTAGRMYTLEFCRVAPTTNEFQSWWAMILVNLGWS